MIKENSFGSVNAKQCSEKSIVSGIPVGNPDIPWESCGFHTHRISPLPPRIFLTTFPPLIFSSRGESHHFFHHFPHHLFSVFLRFHHLFHHLPLIFVKIEQIAPKKFPGASRREKRWWISPRLEKKGGGFHHDLKKSAAKSTWDFSSFFKSRPLGEKQYVWPFRRSFTERTAISTFVH